MHAYSKLILKIFIKMTTHLNYISPSSDITLKSTGTIKGLKTDYVTYLLLLFTIGSYTHTYKTKFTTT